MAPLTLNQDTHRYFYRKKEVPGVSRILELGDMVDDAWFDQATCARGHAVHIATSYDDQGTLDESTVDPQIWPYLCAWRNFRKDSGIKILENEKPRYSTKWGFAGTPDRLIRWKGVRYVLDIKTGGHVAWHNIQTAGYSLLFGFKVKRVGIYLQPNSKYRPKFFNEDPYDRGIFLNTLSVAQWKISNNCNVERKSA